MIDDEFNEFFLIITPDSGLVYCEEDLYIKIRKYIHIIPNVKLYVINKK